MSNLLLENIALRLTRSLEKQVLDVLVEHGYAVDRNAYPDPAAYAAKQTDIKNRKGFCIEVFGHGSAHDRDLKSIPRIVITNGGFTGGSVGNDLIGYTEENGRGGFNKYQGPVRSSNFSFDVELTASKTMQDVVMEAVRGTVLYNFAFIPLYDSPQDTFLIQYGPFRSIPDLTHGLITKIYTYQVLDIFETMPILLDSDISRIKNIKVKDPIDNTITVQVPGPVMITIDSTQITIDSTDITIDQEYEL